MNQRRRFDPPASPVLPPSAAWPGRRCSQYAPWCLADALRPSVGSAHLQGPWIRGSLRRLAHG
eukprot:13929087-Alexandrium_andersonii.AAC.1